MASKIKSIILKNKKAIKYIIPIITLIVICIDKYLKPVE